MSKPLRVLLVEDSEPDAYLLLDHLKRNGYEPVSKRVCNAAEMKVALLKNKWDVVLSDYVIPGFSGPEALKLVRSLKLDIPFIMVSGKMGEETAVEAMRSGAQDYILKNNLTRLIPAIERELKEATERMEHRWTQNALYESEDRFRLVADAATDAILTLNQNSVILYANSAVEKIFGHKIEKLIGQPFSLLVPDYMTHLRDAFSSQKEGDQKRVGWEGLELKGLHKEGAELYLEVSLGRFGPEGGHLFTCIARDVTLRRREEQSLRENQRYLEALSENSQDIAAVVDKDWVFSYVSSSIFHHLGYKPEHVIGHDIFDFIHPEDSPAIFEAFSQGLLKEAAFNLPEFRLKHKNGSWVDIQATGKNLLKNAQIHGVILNARCVKWERVKVLA